MPPLKAVLGLGLLVSACALPALCQAKDPRFSQPPELKSASRSQPAGEGAVMQITLSQYAHDPDPDDQLRYFLLAADEPEAMWLHDGVLRYRYRASSANAHKRWATVQVQDRYGNLTTQSFGFQWRSLPPTPPSLDQCDESVSCWQQGFARLFPQLNDTERYRAEDLVRADHYLNLQLSLADFDPLTPNTALSISHPALHHYLHASAKRYHQCLSAQVAEQSARKGIIDAYRSLPATANIVLTLTPLERPLSGPEFAEIGPFVYVHAHSQDAHAWSIENFYDINLEEHSPSYVPTARNAVGFVEPQAARAASTLASLLQREVRRSYTLLIRRAYEQFGEVFDPAHCLSAE